MTTQATPRFVHIQQPSNDGKYNGLTIAYTRTDDHVFFAYALCCKPDQYEKSVGRKVSTDTYLKNIDFVGDDVLNINIEKRVGCIPVESLHEFLQETVCSNVFADHILDKLTWFDVKHAFISQMLSGYVIENLEV